jgi:hypothetical protein
VPVGAGRPPSISTKIGLPFDDDATGTNGGAAGQFQVTA